MMTPVEYRVAKYLKSADLISPRAIVNVVSRSFDHMIHELALGIIEHSPDLDGDEDTLP